MAERNYLNLTQVSLELTGKEGTVRINSPYEKYKQLIKDCNDFINNRIHKEKTKTKNDENF